MLFGNTIEFTHMALGLVPEILDAIDMVVTVCKEFGMVDPEGNPPIFNGVRL